MQIILLHCLEAYLRMSISYKRKKIGRLAKKLSKINNA